MKPFSVYNRASFFGRSFDELMLCFGLRIDELVGKSVLDCPAGPSSFTATANRLGIRAIGVDPMFYRGPDALARLAYSDFKEMYRKMRAKPEFFVAKTYPSIDASEEDRLGALESFLADYRSMYSSGQYIAAGLPHLPFTSGAFDVALCGHLLFIYEGLFGHEFFLAALRELCRVAKEEVRAHPIVDASGTIYSRLNEVMEAARSDGHDPKIIEVDHAFFRGTHQTLVIRKGNGKRSRTRSLSARASDLPIAREQYGDGTRLGKVGTDDHSDHSNGDAEEHSGNAP